MRSATLSIICAVAIAGCSTGESGEPDVAATPTEVSAGTASDPVPDATAAAATATVPFAGTETTTASAVTDQVVATTAPSATLPVTTVQTTTTSSTTTTVPPTTEPPLPSTPYLVPLRDPVAAGWGEGHSGYPATDIFAACGAEIVSPVNGEVREVRTVDSWDPNVDNPATRGGRSVTIVGDDGVRYYVAHLDEVDPALVAGEPVRAGQRLGTIGLTGRTSACHVHFGISPPCPGREWSVRRGVIPPKPYLDAWRDGGPANPLVEVLAWVNANPAACDEAMADPFAADS